MDIEKICDFGRSVIELEAKMVNGLAIRLNEDFAKACQNLHNCSGRIVVMGIGKSGHIGKKIAATFASTGSPAFFIHPSEAKHGDIGMITSGDVVLVLSNSGESEEILSILPFIKRFNIPLITLTGKPDSKLAKLASINLDVSVEKEACPLGLAPTSSTTAMLVMGDALAMVLLEKRGFTKEDFALSHPGGALGRRLLLRVSEIMHQANALPVVSETASLKEALLEITEKKLGATIVIDDEKQLAGIFTDGDVRRALDNHIDIQNTRIATLMTRHPKTIFGDMHAAEALRILETHQITALIVIDQDNKPIGMVHIHDILRAGII